MRSKYTRRLGATVVTVGLAAFAAAPAFAEEEPAPAPAKPASCTGNLITDPAGDASNFAPDSPQTEFVSESPKNMDIRETFFAYTTGADGKKKLTVNLVVENLDTSPSGEVYSSSQNWEVLFDRPDELTYTARAILKDGKFSFQFDHFVPKVPIPSVGELGTTETATTTGRTFPGPKGIISIDIPTDLILDWKETQAFNAIRAYSEVEYAEQAFYSDRAPDASTSDPKYTLTECVVEEAKTEEKVETKTEEKKDAPAPAAPAAPAPAAETAVVVTPAPVAAPVRPVVKKAASKKKATCAKKAKGKSRKAKKCKAAKKTRKARRS